MILAPYQFCQDNTDVDTEHDASGWMSPIRRWRSCV